MATARGGFRLLHGGGGDVGVATAGRGGGEVGMATACFAIRQASLQTTTFIFEQGKFSYFNILGQ